MSGANGATVLPYTGKEYIDSLRATERNVYFQGQRVKDVTKHPGFRNTAQSYALLYDALHDPAHKDILTTETDTGNGGYTMRYFKVPRSQDDLVKSRDAMAHWQRSCYGWLGRTPDYKAGFLATLGASPEYYGEYADNARNWYKKAQERVLFMNHAIVHPPIDRDLPPDQVRDVMVHVVKETSEGLIIRGAKVVATGAMFTNYSFVAHYGLPFKDKNFALVAAVDMTLPGVKLICRNSYEYQAALSGSPFDYPLSSRMDENDAVLIFDDVLLPWEDVFIYGDLEKSLSYTVDSGFYLRAMLHGCTRMCVKLDFITGLFAKALRASGTSEYRGVKAALGEVATWRNTMWAINDAMVKTPEPWHTDAVMPSLEYGHSYRMIAPMAYVQIKNLIETHVASGLIYTTSNIADFKSPELRPYVDKFIRGSHGMSAMERMKIIKLLWDSVGSEFGGRHELYERNYAGTTETIRFETATLMEANGKMAKLEEEADRCMDEYDESGWKIPGFHNGDDISAVGKNNFE